MLRGRLMRRLAAILIASGLAGPALAQTPAAGWVELTGEGAQVRAVTAGQACPDRRVDGKAQPRPLRDGPSDAFANRICEAPLPKSAKAAAVGGFVLPIPKATPRRIVILGDSGCRL